jgi:uncharacterized small protein (DUF1192 family)
MFESNENNGVHENGTIGNGAETLAPAPAKKKRVSTKDLSDRIAALEKKIEALGAAPSQPEVPPDLEQKMAALMDQIAKLDERVAKIAQSVAQSNLLRPLS